MTHFHDTPDGPVPYTEKEEQERALREEQFPQQLIAAEIKAARAKRNRLLAGTDWRFRSDMTPSQAWKDYCQQLRDVPEQSGFPFNIVWPEAPAA